MISFAVFATNWTIIYCTLAGTWAKYLFLKFKVDNDYCSKSEGPKAKEPKAKGPKAKGPKAKGPKYLTKLAFVKTKKPFKKALPLLHILLDMHWDTFSNHLLKYRHKLVVCHSRRNSIHKTCDI